MRAIPFLSMGDPRSPGIFFVGGMSKGEKNHCRGYVWGHFGLNSVVGGPFRPDFGSKKIVGGQF